MAWGLVRDERGQSTVEWVGTLAVIALVFSGLVAAGVRVPGTELAREVFSRVLCGAAMGGGCGDRPRLIAAYGTEVGKLVRRHMPTIGFEQGSRALPVDFRRCRRSACGDGAEEGVVHRTDERLPVTVFVRVVDCRAGEAEDAEEEGDDCAGEAAGNLYLQYWMYYADSATLRGVPIAGEEGYHADDWEMVELRFRPDGGVDQRASSHRGYNYARGAANWGADADIPVLRDVAELVGARRPNGWGPETGLLLVSGGSHAGNVAGAGRGERFIPGRRVHLIPLEPIAATDRTAFAVTPPWRKRVWTYPESDRTH